MKFILSSFILLFPLLLFAQGTAIRVSGSDDAIRIEGNNNRSDTILDGNIRYFFNGKLLHEGNYVDNRKNGNWTFYFPDGTIHSKGYFLNDLKKGVWEYYEKSKLKEKMHYSDGKLDSTCIWFNEKGTAQKIANYKNDVLHGNFYSMNENGATEMECAYNNGLLNGDFRFFYPSGQIKEESHYVNGILNGACKVFYADGTVMADVAFEMGHIKKVNTYQKQDKTALNQSFIDGNGILTTYYLPEKEGDIPVAATKGNYVNGVPDGKYASWYQNGNKKRKGTFTNGCETGKWKYYSEEGKLSGKLNIKKHKDNQECTCNSFYGMEKEHIVLGSFFGSIDVEPMFPGGEDALTKFIAGNVKYPEKYSLMGIGGQVIVSFIVDEDGFINHTKVASGINDDLNQEALRVVKLMPRWIPGKKDGHSIKVRQQLPINFKNQY